MIRAILFVFILSGCTLRINNENPDVGNPYQKFILVHQWSLP